MRTSDMSSSRVSRGYDGSALWTDFSPPTSMVTVPSGSSHTFSSKPVAICSSVSGRILSYSFLRVPSEFQPS